MQKETTIRFQLFKLSCILIIAAAACSEEIKKPLLEGAVKYPDITGLASPVILQADSTRMVLSDYFLDPKHIDSIHLDGLNFRLDTSAQELWIFGQSVNKISAAHFIVRGRSYDLPLINSDKARVQFAYAASNPGVNEVKLKSSFNGWNENSTILNKVKTGETVIFETFLSLRPGSYPYRVVEDGQEMLDKNNPVKVPNGLGDFNSLLAVGKEDVAELQLRTVLIKQGAIVIDITPDTEILAFWENELTHHFHEGEGRVSIFIPEEAKSQRRSHIRVFGFNRENKSNDLLIPLEFGEVITDPSKIKRDDFHGNVMYFAMVDRFFNGNHANDRRTNDPDILPKANYMGGDLAGITKKCTEGYFDALGINSVWISPIAQNPDSAFGLWNKGITSEFSAYHGYWPISSSKVDDRFGNPADFASLIDTLHNHEINLLLDYVANHVHEQHPLYKNHSDWATSLYLPDGSLNTERWDEHRLTTWFDVFLPTLDFSKPEVVQAMSDSAVLWVQHYPFDGFRHDATKHIQEEFWRSTTQKIKERVIVPDGRKILQIGETYGSPELIASYISSGLMDSQFDFNYYDAAVDALAKPESGFANLGRVLEESLDYYGYHHLMGNITGNQDRTRFISYADGSVRFDEDPKLAGWMRNIENRGEEGYPQLKMLMALLMASPGIPCVFYGDEIGMPGANDPDNRRLMVFENLSAAQKSMFETTKELIAARRNSMPLMYGDTRIWQADESVIVIERTYFAQSALLILSKKAMDTEIVRPENLKGFKLTSTIGTALAVDEKFIRIAATKANTYSLLFFEKK
jgi:glycosidase